ncbi:MAG: sigma-70 family RNA polymerase sigma factor [Polyangiaceae bacterium]
MTADPSNDDELIARASAGDRASFGVLVERHGSALLSLARAIAGDSLAPDVVQDGLLAAFRSASTYRPGASSVRTWLFAIVRHTALRARRTREEPVADVESLETLGVRAGWGADDALAHHEELDVLARALASLAVADREVLVLCDVEGLTPVAAAGVVGIEPRALKSRLHRGRLRLMAAMREHEGSVVEHSREEGGLSCTDVLERLGDYTDGELPAAERARVDLHLRGCGVCARFGGRYVSVVRSARARLGAPPLADDALVASLRAKL